MMSRERECSNSLAALLALHGVTEVVVSPGSRNAPLLEAIAGNNELKVTVVADERSAAFVALGKASVLQKCVTLVCTSGTAMLNYAPALAEAAYRHIPLLAVTADRPHERIGRNDAQTIDQRNAYGSFIKRCFNLDARDSVHYRHLVINDAINAATALPSGPVQLNIELPVPTVDDTAPCPAAVSAIELIQPSMELSSEAMRTIAGRTQAPSRVMIVAGCYWPDEQMYRAISRLCSWGNFVVMADAISNLPPRDGIISNAETVLTGLDSEALRSLRPDIVISHGGPILSSALKNYISESGAEHWHIGLTSAACDTFGRMTTCIETLPEVFYRQLVATARRNVSQSAYTARWIMAAKQIDASAADFISNSPWSDLKAVNTIMNRIPDNYNVQLSNGMTVRYAQMLPRRFHRIDCNRGVSGIDGSTSTAVGASTAYSGNTILITGDMSATYDVGALTLNCHSPRFKIVVIANGGGGIFKRISDTRHYPEVDRYMVACDAVCDIAAIASAIGFRVETATCEKELEKNFPAILAEKQRPAMLVVYTSAAGSAAVMDRFENRTKTSISL